MYDLPQGVGALPAAQDRVGGDGAFDTHPRVAPAEQLQGVADDERATGAGFVHEVDVPKMDEGGNPVFDDKGDPVMEQKSVAYDPDAYSKIVAQLDGRAAPRGDVRELFLEWRYVGADGTAKTWNGYKGEPLTGDKEL